MPSIKKHFLNPTPSTSPNYNCPLLAVNLCATFTLYTTSLHKIKKTFYVKKTK